MQTILYVASTLSRTGPTTQLLNIVRHLRRGEYVPHVLTLSPEPPDSLAPRFRELDIPVHALNHSRLAGLLFARRDAAAIIASLAPGLIHTQGFRSDRLISGMKSPTPHVATIRNFPAKDYLSTYGPLGLAMAATHVSAIRGATNVVAVSGAVADHLQSRLGRRPTVIWNGVDTERFRPTSSVAARVACREQLGLPAQARISVSCGHLSRRKDPLFLISAWRQRFADAADQVLVLAGDGPLRAACEERAQGASNIRLLGRVSDMRPVLGAADLFLSASTAEGCPNAVLEALAAGLPVLLSDIPPHRELVDIDPRAGRLFARSSQPQFLDGLADLQRQGTEEVRHVARALAESRFSAMSMSEAYQALYASVIAAGGRRQESHRQR